MAIAVPQTGPILFQGRGSAIQTIAAANTWAAIALALEDVDDDNGHSNTTNNSRWICARAAKYELSGVVHFFAGAATGLRQVAVFRNGAQVDGTLGTGWSSNTGAITTTFTVPLWLDLVVGDYIELAGQAGTTNAQSYVGGGYSPNLRIRLVR